MGFHPRGLAPLIVNLGEVRAHFVERLERQVAITGDDELAALLEEVPAYPAPEHEPDPASEAGAPEILDPVRFRTPDGGELSFFGTVASFGFAGRGDGLRAADRAALPGRSATAEAWSARGIDTLLAHGAPDEDDVGGMSKPGVGQLIAGAGGVLLIVSLFLPWADVGGVSRNGWELWTMADVFLLIAGLCAIAAAITGGRWPLPPRHVAERRDRPARRRGDACCSAGS